MILNFANSYCDFTKNAIKDYPQWIPDDFKQFLEGLEKIEKDPKLVNFREPVPETFDMIMPYETEIILYFQKIIDQFNSFCDVVVPKGSSARMGNSDFNNFIEQNLQKINDVKQIFFHFELLSTDQKASAIRNNKILIGKQEIKFTKVYSNIRNVIESIYNAYKTYINEYTHFETPLKFDDLPWKKEFDDRLSDKSNLEIVFTTKYADILGMSSRSSWTSCQDIRPEKDFEKPYVYDVLGSCASKYVGIIYLTNKKDYKGRGETMLARCAVWLVRTMENKDAVFMQNMYKVEVPSLRELFSQMLIKNLNLPVVRDVKGARKFYEKFDAPARQPYNDAGIQTFYTQEDYMDLAKTHPDQYLECLTPENYKIVVLSQIKNDPKHIKWGLYADRNWREYKPTIVGAAIKNCEYLRFFDKSWDDYKDLVVGIAFKHPEELAICLRYFNKNWDIYKHYVIKAAKQGLNVLDFVNSEWAEYKDIIIIGAKRFGYNDPDYLARLDPSWEETPLILSDICMQNAGIFSIFRNKLVEIETYSQDKKKINRFAKIFQETVFKKIKDSPYGVTSSYLNPNWDGAKEVILNVVKDTTDEILISKLVPVEWDEYVPVMVNFLENDYSSWKASVITQSAGKKKPDLICALIDHHAAVIKFIKKSEDVNDKVKNKLLSIFAQKRNMDYLMNLIISIGGWLYDEDIAKEIAKHIIMHFNTNLLGRFIGNDKVFILEQIINILSENDNLCIYFIVQFLEKQPTYIFTRVFIKNLFGLIKPDWIGKDISADFLYDGIEPYNALDYLNPSAQDKLLSIK